MVVRRREQYGQGKAREGEVLQCKGIVMHCGDWWRQGNVRLCFGNKTLSKAQRKTRRQMDDHAGDVAICYITQLPTGEQECPLGKDECDEGCEEYFIAYSG